MLTNEDIRELTSFRRELHRTPELSGEEVETARTICGALTELAADMISSGASAVWARQIVLAVSASSPDSSRVR